MEKELVEISNVSAFEEIIKLKPLVNAKDISLVPEILTAFDSCLRDNKKFFLFDLANLDELPPSLIVAIFEITAKARRMGGDVNLLNISDNARRDFEIFEPFSYLADEVFENTALNRFEERILSAKQVDFDEEIEIDNRMMESIHQGQAVSQVFIEIPSKVDSLYKACDFVVNISRNMGFGDADVSKIKISVYEACINVIEHAYHSDPTKSVKVGVETYPNILRITVYDKGDGFNVDNLVIFDAEEAVDNRKRGGMGLPIIKRSMDEVSYKIMPEGENRLIMVKKLAPEPEQTIERV